MKLGLKSKFVIYLIPLIVLICSVFLFFHLVKVTHLAEQGLKQLGYELIKDLSYSSRLALTIDNPELLTSIFEGPLDKEDIFLVAVYDKQGEIVRVEDKLDIGEGLDSEILEKISTLQIPQHFERKNNDGDLYYDFYSPILIQTRTDIHPEFDKQEVIGFCRIALSTSGVSQEIREIFAQSIFIAILVIALGVFTSLFLAERMTKPIKSFIEGTNEIAGGNLNYRFSIKTGDEIEGLANSFNDMISRLDKSQQELQEARDVLEIRVQARTRELEEFANSLNEQVKERTKELSERLVELERFHKLTVDREMKMIELKRELQEVERKKKKKNA